MLNVGYMKMSHFGQNFTFDNVHQLYSYENKLGYIILFKELLIVYLQIILKLIFLSFEERQFRGVSSHEKFN